MRDMVLWRRSLLVLGSCLVGAVIAGTTTTSPVTSSQSVITSTSAISTTNSHSATNSVTPTVTTAANFSTSTANTSVSSTTDSANVSSTAGTTPTTSNGTATSATPTTTTELPSVCTEGACSGYNDSCVGNISSTCNLTDTQHCFFRVFTPTNENVTNDYQVGCITPRCDEITQTWANGTEQMHCCSSPLCNQQTPNHNSGTTLHTWTAFTFKLMFAQLLTRALLSNWNGL